MLFHGMLCLVGLVRAYVSEERIAFIISVTRRVDELNATLAVASNRSTLRRNTGSYRTHMRKIPENSIPQKSIINDHKVNNV
jgi:hypothetical protein